jgi:hypothetical protein
MVKGYTTDLASSMFEVDELLEALMYPKAEDVSADE